MTPASRGGEVQLEIDGVVTHASSGQTIAALLISRGTVSWRVTPAGEPRGAFCGIGVCHDCVVTVNGDAGVKACLTPVRDGMQILTQRRTS
ncbi:(2Fe-2S)-binding protein [Mycobacterium sp. MS1601]|uniref:(2Fe-2S)-binding protein n=1 Tax=Mycobacterium sp. MS1601 TaxID=1936029 RepID=UPI0009FAE5CD|nr:(2Fe-2S)-binding protein [Mycobacterium sp. MS1601]